MNLEEYVLDPEKVEEGVWQDLDDGKVLLGRAFSQKYARAFQKHMEERREAFADSKSDEDATAITEEVMAHTMSESILLGWENLKFRGKKVKYSSKAAYTVLKNVPWFRERVWRMSQLRDPYMANEDGDALGNLLASFVIDSDEGSVTQPSSENSPG